MANNWSIRPATADDADALTDCMRAAYRAYEPRMRGATLPPLQADYAAEIATYPTWVVVADSVVLAGLMMAFDEHGASVSNVAVHPDGQGRGIGGALLRFAEDEARRRGFASLSLATHVLLSENIALYQHLGWRVTGQDETRVFFRKILPGPPSADTESG